MRRWVKRQEDSLSTADSGRPMVEWPESRQWPESWTASYLTQTANWDPATAAILHRTAQLAISKRNELFVWLIRRRAEFDQMLVNAYADVNEVENAKPWGDAWAGLAPFGEWLSVPECASLADLICEFRPWQVSGAINKTISNRRGRRKNYSSKARGPVSAINARINELAYEAAMMLNYQVVYTPAQHIEDIMDLMPMFDRGVSAVIWLRFTHILNQPKPNTGSVE